MKRFILLLLFAGSLKAQKTTETAVTSYSTEAGSRPAPEVFTIMEESPEFPGGPMAMKAFIDKNLVYPERAKKEGIAGKCYVRVIIDETGKVLDPTIIKGLAGCKECDDEALRVVQLMPLWTPGKMSSKPVKSYYNLPVIFR